MQGWSGKGKDETSDNCLCGDTSSWCYLCHQKFFFPWHQGSSGVSPTHVSGPVVSLGLSSLFLLPQSNRQSCCDVNIWISHITRQREQLLAPPSSLLILLDRENGGIVLLFWASVSCPGGQFCQGSCLRCLHAFLHPIALLKIFFLTCLWCSPENQLWGARVLDCVFSTSVNCILVLSCSCWS